MTAPTIHLPATIVFTTPNDRASSAGPNSRTDQRENEPHQSSVGAGQDSAATMSRTSPNDPPSLPPNLPADHGSHDAHAGVVVGDQATGASGQRRNGPQTCPAAAPVHTSATATTHQPEPIPDASRLADPQAGSAERSHLRPDAHMTVAALADPTLALLADVLDDLERTRIANENRLRQLTRDEADSDGLERGFGLDESHPDVARLAGVVDAIAALEHQATLNLNRSLRAHPLGPWVKAQKGIGEKQAARLLAVIGDPYWHDTHERPRTVSELWAYCGHGDPARKRRKGMTQADLFALGNPVAKSRLWLIACAVLKAQGPLVEHYYERKEATEGRLHADVCVRCGPSGKPAQPGSPWSDAHRHADALRILGKQILRGLWLEAKRIHELDDGSGHKKLDTHDQRAGVVVDTTTGEVLP